MVRKLFLILFFGLIALICGPPKLFASVNKNATTVAKTIYFKNTIAGQGNATDQFFITKTVAADQKPILPEYTGNTNYFLNINSRQFAKLLDIGFLIIETRYLKNNLIPGFGRRLQQEA